MFIYLVWHGDYEDREVMGAYSTHELAVAASYRIHGKLSAYSKGTRDTPLSIRWHSIRLSGANTGWWNA